MTRTSPKKLIAIGFILVLIGFIVPLLMVGKIIETSFALGFISYGASVVGLFLGLLGAAAYTGLHRRRQ
jgi:hypothetical protein